MSLRLHLHNLASGVLPNRGGFAIRRALLRWAGVAISADVRVAGGVKVYDRYLEIGSGTWIGMDVRLISNRGGMLKIGSNVDIGPMCLVTTGTHEVGGPDRRAGAGRGEAVTVGDGTWIGMGAVILPGADIGPGSIVAAGAVVIAGTYPANSLLAGVPARVRRELGHEMGNPIV